MKQNNPDPFHPYPLRSLAKVDGSNYYSEFPYELISIYDYRHDSILSFLNARAFGPGYKVAPGGDRLFESIFQIWNRFSFHYYPTPVMMKAISAVRSVIPQDMQDPYPANIPNDVAIEMKAREALFKVYKEHREYFEQITEAGCIYSIAPTFVATCDRGVPFPIQSYPDVLSPQQIRSILDSEPDSFARVGIKHAQYYISSQDPYLQPIYSNEWEKLGLQAKFSEGDLVRLAPGQDDALQHFIHNYPKRVSLNWDEDDSWTKEGKQIADRLQNDFYEVRVVENYFISHDGDIDRFIETPYPILSPDLFAVTQPSANGKDVESVYRRWFTLIEIGLPSSMSGGDYAWVEEQQLERGEPTVDYSEGLYPSEVPYKIGSYVSYKAQTATRLANNIFPEKYLRELGLDPKEIFKSGMGVVVGYLYPYGETDFRRTVWGDAIHEDAKTCELLPLWDEMQEGRGWQADTSTKSSFWMFFDPEAEFFRQRVGGRNNTPELIPIVCVLHPETLNPAFLAYIPLRDIVREVKPSSVSWLLQEVGPDWDVVKSIGISTEISPAGNPLQLNPAEREFEIM